ncbi:MAG: hypothetical protein KF724_08055 [Phycisphaeraceae bacterium]|nr:hypothetical protein [Phycisphaeraceae bacterium]
MPVEWETLSTRVATMLRRAAAILEQQPQLIDHLLSELESRLDAIEASDSQEVMVAIKPGSENGRAGADGADAASPRAAAHKPHAHAGPALALTPMPDAQAAPALTVTPKPDAVRIESLDQEAIRAMLSIQDNLPTRSAPKASVTSAPKESKIAHLAAEWSNSARAIRSMEVLIQGVRRAGLQKGTVCVFSDSALLSALETADPTLGRRVARAIERLRGESASLWPLDIRNEPPTGLLVNTERAYAALRLSMEIVADELKSLPRSVDSLVKVKGQARERLAEAVKLVAEAQCMVRCAVSAILLGPLATGPRTIGCCSLQDRAHAALRELVALDQLAIRIDQWMRIDDVVSAAGASKLQRRLQRFRDSLRREREGVALLPESEVDDDGDDSSPPKASRFESVADAVAEADRLFAGGGDAPLLFLDSAHESAADSPFKRPDEAFELLSALADAAKRWRDANGLLGRSFASLLEEKGYGEKPISQTAAIRYGSEYMFDYAGEKRLFELHWTLGSRNPNTCISIHWFRDPETRQVVVGYCGRHLSNTKT